MRETGGEGRIENFKCRIENCTGLVNVGCISFEFLVLSLELDEIR